jgi:hypothetical protein
MDTTRSRRALPDKIEIDLATIEPALPEPSDELQLEK